MLESHDFDNPWRPIYEWPMTATWLGASAITLAVTKALPVPTRFGVATALFCAGMGALRARQAWMRNQDTSRVRLAEKQFIDIPTIIREGRNAQAGGELWLGKGFQWTDIEAGRMHALINGGVAAQLGKEAIHKEGAYWLHGLAQEKNVGVDLSLLDGHRRAEIADGVQPIGEAGRGATSTDRDSK